jgi:hypothetical protein
MNEKDYAQAVEGLKMRCVMTQRMRKHVIIMPKKMLKDNPPKDDKKDDKKDRIKIKKDDKKKKETAIKIKGRQGRSG